VEKIVSPPQLASVDESYTLDVSSNGIIISAKTSVGLAYALQTLSQLVTVNGTLVRATISDAPRFSYRGFMFDTARNFFPVEDIMRIMDGMFYSKLNVFHWHIYDSQSFPIKWDRYPQLEKATFKYANGTSKLYTKSDVKAIINYAFLRNIRVIPEFEMPGHCGIFGYVNPALVLGWNHSPWDGKNGEWENATKKDKVIWDSGWCAEPPCGQLNIIHSAYLTIIDLLITDVGNWFVDPILHVGHDEVNPRPYGLVPSKNGEPVVAPLMRGFEPKLIAILDKNKKRYAAWDEVTTDYGIAEIIPRDSLITLWLGQSKVPTIVGKGLTNIVVGNFDSWYLDCSPSVTWCLEGYEKTQPDTSYNIPGYHTYPGQWHNWTKQYLVDPLGGLTEPSYINAVKGGFGALFTETIKRHNLDRYAFPRLAVIAERLWTYSKASYDAEVTPVRLGRFRASLIDELAIGAAPLDYLGNGEDMVFRTEWCDGAGRTAPGQKTNECCFSGEPTTGGNGGPVREPSYFADPADYCKIAGLYVTNDLKYVKPKPVPYPF